MLADISRMVIEFIRLHPAEFITYCVIGSLLLIILSYPALLLRIALFGSLVLTGIAIIVHQINVLTSTIQGIIISTVQQAFDQLNRLLK